MILHMLCQSHHLNIEDAIHVSLRLLRAIFTVRTWILSPAQADRASHYLPIEDEK
jgi:hypothetical protein